MDGVAYEEDFDQYGDAEMEDDDDEEVCIPRRKRTMLPKIGLPFKRRSHDAGLNYSTGNKKGKKTILKGR